jgi:hypothetical protein
MKKALVPVMLSVVLIAAGVLAGCETITPGGETIITGEVITEELPFEGFTGVDIGSAFEVEITRADTFSVVIRADESLYDYVEVSKSGDTLKIYLKPHHIFTDFTIGAKVLKAEITMPVLDELTLSGATTGAVTGFDSTRNLKLNVSGASALEIINGGFGDIECEVSGASSVSGNMTADDIEMEISGASSVELGGIAGDLNLEVSGASRADMANFSIENAGVVLSGASEATLNVKDKLDTELSGASRLYFYGNPDMGTPEVSGASTIKHK